MPSFESACGADSTDPKTTGPNVALCGLPTKGQSHSTKLEQSSHISQFCFCLLNDDGESVFHTSSLPAISTTLCFLLLALLFAVASAKVKVVLVAGQSNCQGFGDKFHLNELVLDSTTGYAKYGSLEVNAEGLQLATRDDVVVVTEPE